MTAYSELDITIQSYQEGAFEYLAKPFDIDEAIELVKQAYEKSVHAIEHLPDSDIAESITVDNWKTALKQWAHTALENGENAILTKATHDFEKTLIECALTATRGRKQEAAKRLGWGRNTLTRKLKELYNSQ